MIIHTVGTGETVYSIARQYGISPELLAINNGLENVTERLPVGLSLVVLVPKLTYTVKQGDTLRSIAARFGVSHLQLYRRNLILGGKSLIYPGQTLIIEYSSQPQYSYSIGGYYYTFVSDEQIDESIPFTKLFMPFTYGFNLSGQVIKINASRLVERGYYYGSAPFFHLSTLDQSGAFSNELSHRLFQNTALWEVLADNVISTMLDEGFSGLDIDFEFVYSEDRLIYPQFLEYIKNRLRDYAFELIVAVPPKTSSTQSGTLYEGADYRLIGQSADYVLCMTYEWGYTYGPPMPVSPTPSIRRVLDYAISEIPPEKIYMGISNYGYDWRLPYISGETMAKSLSNVDAVELASRNGAEIFYSEEYSAPYFEYTDADGAPHEVWFEDARSIYAKLEMIKQYGFKGGLYWNLNRKNPQNLALLSETMYYGN